MLLFVSELEYTNLEVSKAISNKINIALVALVLFASGAVTGFYMKSKGNQEVAYPLLARRVQLNNPSEPKLNFNQLHLELNSYIDKLSQDQPTISVYFEYLPTGAAVSINEHNLTVAASLMKLPVVMNLYKASDMGLINLDREVALKKEWLNSEYGSLYKKGEGYRITLREAARLALKDSDNTALLLIWDELGMKIDANNNVMNYLDVDYKSSSDQTAAISAKSYTSILKCLYFACHGSLASSQEILGYLTESSFNNRLRRDIPQSIKIAHKIGTYHNDYQSDCGVVYLETRNYVVCIMVKGSDPQASQIIADISAKIYNYVKQYN